MYCKLESLYLNIYILRLMYVFGNQDNKTPLDHFSKEQKWDLMVLINWTAAAATRFKIELMQLYADALHYGNETPSPNK